MAVTNQISPEEDQRLAEHLEVCAVCKQTFDHFSQIAAQLYGQAPTSKSAAATFHEGKEASDQVRARERLLGKVRQTINLPLNEDHLAPVGDNRKTAWRFSLQQTPSWATLAFAAALLLAVSLDLTQSWLSRNHSKEEAMTSARLKREVDELRTQLARLQAVPSKPVAEAHITTKEKEDDLQKLRADDEATHQALLSTEATRQRQVGENAELQARIRLLQSSLEVLQVSNASLEAEKSGLTEKVSSVAADLRKSQDELGKLAARNEELSQQSLVHVKSVERQQKLLATDHDITDILGARSLHIIDVFDVSSQGEFEHAFGRIFYTEGKSLIFYAFDLDQQKGLKRGAVFQAWGRRGVGREDARSLGLFYMDDPTQNRWVLKVDDSKVLSRIDYVFVTDSSRRENPKPKGKPLLSAFLNATANHP